MFVGLAARDKHRLVRFMAKKSVFDNPVSGPLMRAMHHIPVDRSAGASAYGVAVTALRDGELVGVFPESTISRAFVPRKLKSGRGADGARGRTCRCCRSWSGAGSGSGPPVASRR